MTMARLEVRVKPLESALEQRFDGLESQIVQLRAEMRSEFSAIRDALVETNRHMRVLHEDVLACLKAIEHG